MSGEIDVIGISEVYDFVHSSRVLKDTLRYSNNSLVGTKDTVASHTWRAEMFPILLREEFEKEGINATRVLELLNLHDQVERESGEVEALGHRNREEKKQREERVADNLFSSFSGLWIKRANELTQEFMAQVTIESKVAKALENLESNMHVIEEIKPILDPDHRKLTIEYVERRRGISKVVDALIEIQLKEIDKITCESGTL
jgi:putative hydrolase of HD superfamily